MIDALQIPAYYDVINKYNAQISPNKIKSRNAAVTMFFQRYLFQKVLSRYDFTIPDTWDYDYFTAILFGWGFEAIINTKAFGVIPQQCTLKNRNIFYQPSEVLVANPLLPGYTEQTIGRDCALIKMAPDYAGCLDLVTTYADMMAVCVESVGINLFNSKLAYIFGVHNKAQAEAIKKMMDMVSRGDPAVVADKDLFNDDGSPSWMPVFNNLKQNYIGSQLLEDLKKIEAQFDSYIGFNNVNIAKESGVSSDEVHSNDISSMAIATLWLDTMRRGIDQANRIFPDLNLSVKFKEVKSNDRNTVDLGNVPLQSEGI